MQHRTTLVLDAETRKAARDLARHYGCSFSEAVRRAVVRHRNSAVGVSVEDRQRRVQTLKKLCELFEGSDPEAEIRRLKAEDPGF